jgi:hypothetical protein
MLFFKPSSVSASDRIHDKLALKRWKQECVKIVCCISANMKSKITDRGVDTDELAESHQTDQ